MYAKFGKNNFRILQTQPQGKMVTNHSWSSQFFLWFVCCGPLPTITTTFKKLTFPGLPGGAKWQDSTEPPPSENMVRSAGNDVFAAGFSPWIQLLRPMLGWHLQDLGPIAPATAVLSQHVANSGNKA